MDKLGSTPRYIEVPIHEPPPAYYGSPPQPQQPTAVVQVVIQTPPVQFGPRQQTVTCPHCRHGVLTRTKSQATTTTHALALLLCLFGCWLCCCIPYFVDSCQDQEHYCPNCRVFLGRYQP